MKPVLYEKNETQFRTFGLGEIADAYVVEVTRERNGNYTLYIKYPLDGFYAARFQNGMKIKADAGVRTKWQTFEISRVKRNSKEHIEVFAKHISHQTEYLQLNPKVKAGQQTAGMALSLWRSNLVGGAVFDVWSDIEAVADINWEIGTVNNAREALGGVAGSILDRFGGEYEFDNTLIRLHRRLGRQAPIVLEYGRNVVSIEQDDSLEEVYTSIYPYAKYTPQTEGETQAEEVLVTLPELVVDGPYLANFDKRRIKLVDFSGQFQDQEVPTVAKLRSLAQSYVISNRIGLAKVAIEVDYVDLAKTLDYKDFAVMEEVELCDVIPLYYPKFGITSSEEKVVEVVYDVLNDENKTIKLGTIGQSISQQLTSSVVERVEHLEKKQASQDQVLSSYLVDSKGNRVWRERPGTNLEHKVGDVWFEKNGLYERMYIWNGNQWEKILDTEDVDRVGKQVEAVQAKANQIAAEASQAGQKADQALTRAGASQSLAQTAKDTADRAIRQAGDNLRTAQERASQLQTDLDAAKRTITSQARDILNQAKAQSDLTRKVQTVEETANGTKTTVTELTKTVDANTGNLTSVTQRVATAENTLTNVRNQYSTLKTTVDGQSGKVTSLERQTADLSNGLDGVKERFENLSVGAKNFIPDFGFEKNQQFALHQSDWTFERIEDATARSGYLIKATCRRAGGGGFHRVLFDLRGSEWQGKTMTYAVDVKASRAVSMRIGAEAFEGWGKVHDVTTTWKRVAQTGTVAFNQWHSFMWYINEGAWRVGDVVYLRDPQLEEGTFSTTPMAAEEDFRQEFATYIRNANENTAQLERNIQTADGKAESAKTQAQQTADSLKLKAEKTDLDTVSGRVDTAEATIELHAKALTQRLTSTQVEEAIAGKGYQTKDDVDTNITGRGYITSSALDSYVPTTSFDNYKTETAQSIERGLTETRALIPTEFSGNILKDGKQTWRNSRGATYTLDDDLEPGRDYTLTIRYWNGTGGQAVSTNLFGSWQVGVYDSAVDAWVIRGQSSVKQTKGYTFAINVHPGTGLGNADWATLTKGPLAMSRYQEPFSSFVTSADFQKVQETAQLYERIIGKTEGDITANLARQVMASDLYQTEVTRANWDSRNYLRNGSFAQDGDRWRSSLTGSGLSVSYEHSKASDNRRRSGVHIWGTATSRWRGLEQQFALKLTAGQKVTMSSLVSKDGSPTGTVNWGIHFRSNGAIASQLWRNIQPSEVKDGSYERISWTVVVPADCDELNVMVQFAQGQPVNYYLTELALSVSDRFVGYAEALEDGQAVATRVSQLADSYAIKTLGSAGQVLSAINLATGGAIIQAGQNKLVVTPDTTYIQNGTIKSAMIESLDAGKITAGILDAAKARIINLDVNSVNGLDANFIKSKIELALVDWLKGKMITAQSGATTFNLNDGRLNFHTNDTGVFRVQPNASTQGMLFQNSPITVGGVQRVQSRVILGAERRGDDLSTKWNRGGFNGVVVDTIFGVGTDESPTADRVNVVGDVVRIVHTYDTDDRITNWSGRSTGWEFRNYAPGNDPQHHITLKPININPTQSDIFTGDVWLYTSEHQKVSLKSILRNAKLI